MPGLDKIETKESKISDDIADLKELKTSIFLERMQVNSIIEGLSMFYINSADFGKKRDLVNYICAWKLWSNERLDLEKMVTRIIYWSYEKGKYGQGIQPSIREAWTRKIKYIHDNYWKSIDKILIEINEKEKSLRRRPVQNKEDGWFLDRISDAWNYWIEKLSNLWNTITNTLPTQVTNWIKTNLFSPEKQKNTENINEIYKKLQWREKPDFFPFYLAIQWYNKNKSSLKNKKYLTVIDYSKPVSQKRLYVINMDTLTVENCVTTWHWQNSWNTQTTSSFSNADKSKQTSIGFFRTPMDLRRNSRNTWSGLFLKWQEYSNNNAEARWIAVHQVKSFFYWTSANGHKAWDATSEGCITIRSIDDPNGIMNKIKWDSLIYSYYPDMIYLNKSTMIK